MNEKKREVVEPHRTDSPVDRWPTLRRFGEDSGAAPLNREESEYLESKQLYRELQVQRSELEQQNEELSLARVEIEAGLQKYYELYDFAPVGYCTIDRQGIVRESNLAGALLLAVDRPRLLNRCLGDFVPREACSGLDLFY
jgi:PAS domain-containing protein